MANSLAHTKWMCKYHIVFTPKYRRKIIYNKYKESIVEISERSMQVERGGDHRGESDGGSYPPAGVDPAEDECVELHGVPEREECADDL